MACRCPVIGDSLLESWKLIDSGGFGKVYKARHKQLCCEVAVKVLHNDDRTSSSLLHEVEMMRQGSSPYVIYVHGVFKGRLASGPLAGLGLVMEFMERGSLALLQKSLGEPVPWSLCVRLAHQVALGINFLHCLKPALLHLDLKPSNVLLDSDLNAKLTDFGLAKIDSACEATREAGTTNYMPPEAFKKSYCASPASDIYSYGILLWSIITGEQPYRGARSSLVRLRIPQGDRPSLADLQNRDDGQTGLARYRELMEKCWAPKPLDRPCSYECTTETEDLYKMHKYVVKDAVCQVLKKLDQNEEHTHEGRNGWSITSPHIDHLDHVVTGPVPIQEEAVSVTQNHRTSLPFREPRPGNVPARRERSPRRKAETSSVHPFQQSHPRPAQAGATCTPHLPNGGAQFVSYQEKLPPQRQQSSPSNFAGPLLPQQPINITLSNVSYFQLGLHNKMNIQNRRRHPTAPPAFNHTPPPSSRGGRTGERR